MLLQGPDPIHTLATAHVWMTDLSASLCDLGDTILQAFLVQPQLFTLACQQVLVQADELKVALHASHTHIVHIRL